MLYLFQGLDYILIGKSARNKMHTKDGKPSSVASKDSFSDDEEEVLIRTEDLS